MSAPERPESSLTVLRREPKLAAVAGGAILVAVCAAIWRSWACDDAFISFRYALNWVEGKGLVYNAGERVEGYTNLLWTLWVGVGLKLGVAAETWATVWGIVFYALCVAILFAEHLSIRVRAHGWTWPAAAILAALMADWNIWATGGLEGSLYTFWLLAGYRLLVGAELGSRRAAVAGVIFALAALTRPDGMMPAGLAGLFVLWQGRDRLAGALSFGLAFLAIWLPATLWRVGYYGDFFPNTYYAKSGNLAWYGQGAKYLLLFFARYWPLLLAAPAAALVLFKVGSPDEQRSRRAALGPRAALAGAIAISYTLYLCRVGGDFMFARLMLPTAPFYLILLEIGLSQISRRGPRAYSYTFGVLALLWVITPKPVTANIWLWGVADEHEFYDARRVGHAEFIAEGIAPALEGLPVRIAFWGASARWVYRARVHTAVECVAGLTDRYLARRPISKRGRVGHEKRAPLDYLIRRRMHLTFNASSRVHGALDRVIPREDIAINGRPGRIITWDPVLMAALKQRGADFEDFPARLDRYIAEMGGHGDSKVAEDFTLFENFYFKHVVDRQREQAFLSRLGR
jgi:arabinofuranosyltransferase